MIAYDDFSPFGGITNSYKEILNPIDLESFKLSLLDNFSSLKDQTATEKSEQPTSKIRIFAYEAPKGMCMSILQALFRFSDLSNQSSKNTLFPIQSAIVLPNRPNTIFIEGTSEKAIIDILPHFPELQPIPHNLVEITQSQHVHVFFNPIKCLPYRIGLLIRAQTPEFPDEICQIVDIEPNKGRVLVKALPHIDYPELIRFNLPSQRVLNSQKSLTYKAPRVPFLLSKISNLTSLTGTVYEKQSIRIWNQSFEAILWDKNIFIGEFQYLWFEINEICLTNNFKDEYDFFDKGMSDFERQNSTFVTNFNSMVDASLLPVFHCEEKILKIHQNIGIPSWASISHRSNSATETLKIKPAPKVRMSGIAIKSNQNSHDPKNKTSISKDKPKKVQQNKQEENIKPKKKINDEPKPENQQVQQQIQYQTQQQQMPYQVQHTNNHPNPIEKFQMFVNYLNSLDSKRREMQWPMIEPQFQNLRREAMKYHAQLICQQNPQMLQSPLPQIQQPIQQPFQHLQMQQQQQQLMQYQQPIQNQQATQQHIQQKQQLIQQYIQQNQSQQHESYSTEKQSSSIEAPTPQFNKRAQKAPTKQNSKRKKQETKPTMNITQYFQAPNVNAKNHPQLQLATDDHNTKNQSKPNGLRANQLTLVVDNNQSNN